jgi:hypothetical protein
MNKIIDVYFEFNRKTIKQYNYYFSEDITKSDEYFQVNRIILNKNILLFKCDKRYMKNTKGIILLSGGCISIGQISAGLISFLFLDRGNELYNMRKRSIKLDTGYIHQPLFINKRHIYKNSDFKFNNHFRLGIEIGNSGYILL